ncbi:RNA-binding S4 domain-containing protein [Falsiroseomonas oryzae]|uniref:RNA-binding S4 domain-containing protein n=1 Tax=Falsiroseomonas oryzae TaxID=2766473 RepID=UPI0022EA3C8E|nr:RNA-binding S4 domain-containing protein [Roseomonas sp. MO-31]
MAAPEAGPKGEDSWQRLDLWLWCARLAKTRSECARQVAAGAVRLNRQPTDKAHARLRVGDVLTLAAHGRVRVWRVVALAERRGPPAEARTLYEDLSGDTA